MWDIIIWKNENAIDFVPCNWANENNTMYKYPLGMSETKVRETIYECKELCENYKWCDVELRKQCIKSLQRAKELCDKGQYTSNLETSDDENEDTKRKRTKRYIEECGQSEKRKTVGRRQLEEEDHNKDSEEETSTDRRKTFNFPERHARRNIEIRSETSSPQSGSSTPKNPASRETSVDLLRAVLRNQAQMQFEIKELQKKIDVIHNKQLTTSTGQGGREGHPTTESRFTNLLPIRSLEGVQEVEELIQDDMIFKDLAHFLYLVGGDTLSRLVYNIMKKLLVPDVSILYSGIGKKRKLPFCSLKIYKAIQVAIRKRDPIATEQNIKKTVALYLSQSKSRLKTIDSSSTTSKDSDQIDEQD